MRELTPEQRRNVRVSLALLAAIVLLYLLIVTFCASRGMWLALGGITVILLLSVASCMISRK